MSVSFTNLKCSNSNQILSGLIRKCYWCGGWVVKSVGLLVCKHVSSSFVKMHVRGQESSFNIPLIHLIIWWVKETWLYSEYITPKNAVWLPKMMGVKTFTHVQSYLMAKSCWCWSFSPQTLKRKKIKRLFIEQDFCKLGKHESIITKLAVIMKIGKYGMKFVLAKPGMALDCMNMNKGEILGRRVV